MSNKNIKLDKYYTPIDTANKCWDRLESIIDFNNVSEIIEPSCGSGAFFHYDKYKPSIGYDIQPECDFNDVNVITGDFLENDLVYKKGRLFIGNPPFGVNNTLSIKFYNKCCELGDYIAFILPISQLNNNLQLYKFDLIDSYDLGIQEYSGIKLHCCFNIYNRPENGEYNKIPDVRLKEITIIEHRRKIGDYSTGKNKDIDENYDYAMCNWGSGCLGKVPTHIGEYAQEVYFYCHDKKYLSRMIELLNYDTIRKYVNSISSKRISVARLYLYLYNNIEGLHFINEDKLEENKTNLW